MAQNYVLLINDMDEKAENFNVNYRGIIAPLVMAYQLVMGNPQLYKIYEVNQLGVLKHITVEKLESTYEELAKTVGY